MQNLEVWLQKQTWSVNLTREIIRKTNRLFFKNVLVR
jgi:hypothetical protein